MSSARAPQVPQAPTARRANDAAIRAGLAIGPILACVGIAWTAIDPSAFSSAAVLAGLLACFYATHRFGRLGAEEGRPADAQPRVDDAATPTPTQDDAREAERLRKAREDERARDRRRG